MLKVKQLQVPQHYHKGAKVQNQNSEADPVFVASPAYSINSSDLTDIKNLSGTNTGDQDLSDYVKGPASAVSGHNVVFDGVTGKLIKAGEGLIVLATAQTIAQPASTGYGYVDLTGFSFAVVADKPYFFEIEAFSTCDDLSGRQRTWIAPTGPTSPTYLIYHGEARSGTSAVTTGQSDVYLQSSHSATYFNSGGTSKGYIMFRLNGWVVPSAGGTVQFQTFAYNNAYGDIQWLPGSQLRWRAS